MTLLIGTSEGLFRANELPFDDAERVLDFGRTSRVRRFDGIDGVFAATETGLYRSTDDGRTWDGVEVPESRVWEPFAAADGRFYVGTQPARLFVSADGFESWEELEALQNDPSRELWRSAFGIPRVRGIGSHADTPDRLLVGIEAGGLFLSEDSGESWRKCRINGQTDIHQVLAVDADRYVVPCGRLSIYDRNHAAAEGGLYSTEDGGKTWSRLDDALDPSYYRSALVHDGTLYACGALTVPPEWRPDRSSEASLFTSTDMGATFEEEPYPGGPEEIVLAWEGRDDVILGGTASGPEGRVIRRTAPGEWETAGTVPADIHAIQLL